MATGLGQAGHERLRLRARIARLTTSLAFQTQAVIAVGGLALVVLLQIPWIQPSFNRLGFTDSSAIFQMVLLIVAVSIFFDVRTLLSESRLLNSESSFFHDPMDVYPALLDNVRSTKRADQKTIDVIGMTLYTAWPSIRFWLQRSDMTGWRISFSGICDTSHARNPHVPPEWYPESLGNLKSIATFAQSPQNLGNEIRAYGYDFMPSIHGYKLGTGDLYWSALRWREDGLISLDGYSYEYVSARDKSPAAEAKRQVFNSWLRRSQQTAIS